MTEDERKAAIEAHRLAHERKISRRAKARVAADARKKERGLASFVARLAHVQESKP